MKNLVFFCFLLTSLSSKSQNPFVNSLSFDGDEAHVQVPHHSSLNMTNSMTLEVRVWAADYDPGGWQEFVYKGGNGPFDSSGPREYYIRPQNDSGRAQFKIHDDQDNTYSSKSDSSLVNGMCYHLAGTYDGNVMKMYVNGILEDIDTIGLVNIQQSTDMLAFARQGSRSVEEFDGYLDEIRIWNIARNQEQICAYMNDTLGAEYYTNSESGLVGYWRLDEESGDVAYDLTQNVNHGSLVDGPLHISARNDIPTCTSTSISQFVNNSIIRVYPNPAQNEIIIESKELNNELLVFNLQGQLVKRKTLIDEITVLEVESFPQGQYLFQVRSSEKVFVSNISVVH